MTYAELLKNTRESKGISQEKAANELHVSQAYYSRLERGLTAPDEKLTKIILQFCEITPEQAKDLHFDSHVAQKQKQSKKNAKGKETVWVNEFRQVVFLILIALSIPFPICAWIAIYWAYRSKFRKWVVIAVAIFAFALTFFYLDQIYLILPTKTWYEVTPY